jgi:hypothetical protein
MPESVTDKRIIFFSGHSYKSCASTVICPLTVNFNALLRKLRRTYRILFGSDFIFDGIFLSKFTFNFIFFDFAYRLTSTVHSLRRFSRENGTIVNLNFPLSICTKSRISFIRFNNNFELCSAGFK